MPEIPPNVAIPKLAKVALTAGRVAYKPFEVPAHMTNAADLAGGATWNAIAGSTAALHDSISALQPRGPAKWLTQALAGVSAVNDKSMAQGNKMRDITWKPLSEGSLKIGDAVGGPGAVFYAGKAGYPNPKDPWTIDALLRKLDPQSDPADPQPAKYPTYQKPPDPPATGGTPAPGGAAPAAEAPPAGETPPAAETPPGAVPEGDPNATPGTVPEGIPDAAPGAVPDIDPNATPGAVPEGDPNAAAGEPQTQPAGAGGSGDGAGTAPTTTGAPGEDGAHGGGDAASQPTDVPGTETPEANGSPETTGTSAPTTGASGEPQVVPTDTPETAPTEPSGGGAPDGGATGATGATDGQATTGEPPTTDGAAPTSDAAAGADQATQQPQGDGAPS